MEVRMKIYRVVMLVRKENIGKEMTYATLEKENQWAKNQKSFIRYGSNACWIHTIMINYKYK